MKQVYRLGTAGGAPTDTEEGHVGDRAPWRKVKG